MPSFLAPGACPHWQRATRMNGTGTLRKVWKSEIPTRNLIYSLQYALASSTSRRADRIKSRNPFVLTTGTQIVLRLRQFSPRLHNRLTLFSTLRPEAFGVAVWGSAIRKFKKRYLGLDGNTKWKNKLGRSGKNSCTACSVVRFASPRQEIEKLDGV